METKRVGTKSSAEQPHSAPDARAASAQPRSLVPPASQASVAQTLCLPSDCTGDATAIKSQLLAHLEWASAVCLDVREVRRVDTAALQLLAAFVRERRTSGRPTSWSALSEAFETSVRKLGMRPLLFAEKD